MEYFGYSGRNLMINLDEKEIRTSQLKMSDARRFIGGWGLSMQQAARMIGTQTDPLSSDNAVTIGAGPLVCTIAPASGKIVGTTKYPVSGIVAGAVGGTNRFGVNLKKAGYDQIIIKGKARTPVYLKIIDEDVEIENAGNLWNVKDTYQTDDNLRKKYGLAGGTVTIGKAGENLSKISLSIVDKIGTLGRGGLAAVMGSKNLKAIYVKGTQSVKIKFRDRFNAAVHKIREIIMKNENYISKKIFELGWFIEGWDSYRITFTEGVWSRRELDEAYGLNSFLKAKKLFQDVPSACIPAKHPMRSKKETLREKEPKQDTSHASEYSDRGWDSKILGMQ